MANLYSLYKQLKTTQKCQESITKQSVAFSANSNSNKKYLHLLSVDASDCVKKHTLKNGGIAYCDEYRYNLGDFTDCQHLRLSSMEDQLHDYENNACVFDSNGNLSDIDETLNPNNQYQIYGYFKFPTETVLSIGSDLGQPIFKNLSCEEHIVLSKIKYIGSKAFQNSNVEDLTIGSSIEYISHDAFANSSIKHLKIQKKYTEIGHNYPYGLENSTATIEFLAEEKKSGNLKLASNSKIKWFKNGKNCYHSDRYDLVDFTMHYGMPVSFVITNSYANCMMKGIDKFHEIILKFNDSDSQDLLTYGQSIGMTKKSYEEGEEGESDETFNAFDNLNISERSDFCDLTAIGYTVFRSAILPQNLTFNKVGYLHCYNNNSLYDQYAIRFNVLNPIGLFGFEVSGFNNIIAGGDDDNIANIQCLVDALDNLNVLSIAEPNTLILAPYNYAEEDYLAGTRLNLLDCKSIILPYKTYVDSISCTNENVVETQEQKISSCMRITDFSNSEIRIDGYSSYHNMITESLQSFELSGTGKIVEVGKDMFNGCTRLSTIDLEEAECIGDYAFNGVSALGLTKPLVFNKKIDIGKLALNTGLRKGASGNPTKTITFNANEIGTISLSAFYDEYDKYMRIGNEFVLQFNNIAKSSISKAQNYPWNIEPIMIFGKQCYCKLASGIKKTMSIDGPSTEIKYQMPS